MEILFFGGPPLCNGDISCSIVRIFSSRFSVLESLLLDAVWPCIWYIRCGWRLLAWVPQADGFR
jgi:hypothetical protein